MTQWSRREFVKAAGIGGVALFGGHALLACGPEESAADPAGAGGEDVGAPDAGLDDMGAQDATPEPDAVEQADVVEEPDGGFWTQGNYAPVDGDLESFELEVEGAIPPALLGVYVRNGPNPMLGDSPHWFFGDGMLHGVRLERGRAAWYRAKYVQTGLLGRADGIGGGPPSIRDNHSNTSVVHHGGRLLSLNEVGLPHDIDPADLSTKGVFDYGGALQGPMTAHPKRDPATGRLHFFGYNFRPPYLVFHTADAAGNLVRSVPIEVPASTMMHDFQITDGHAIFMDLPILFDLQAAIAGGFPFAWRPDNGARIGVMPLEGGNADVVWIEVEPCFIFHTLNAFRDPDSVGKIILTASRYPTMWAEGPNDFSSDGRLARYSLDLAAATASLDFIDDRHMEFPRIDPRRQGLSNRYGYGLGFARERQGATDPAAIRKYDLGGGQVQTFDFAPGRIPAEALFVPDSPGAGEDEGWLLSFVYDGATDSSTLDIFDATALARGPVARIKLPRRVPFGFHGTWVPDA